MSALRVGDTPIPFDIVGVGRMYRAADVELFFVAGEMLAASEHALRCIEQSTEYRLGNPAFEHSTALLRAAIAKATGAAA